MYLCIIKLITDLLVCSVRLVVVLVSVVPKRMVTIFGRRVSLWALLYAGILILLILSLALPWISLVLSLKPTATVGCAEGYVRVNIFLWGIERVESAITGTDSTGRKALLESSVESYRHYQILPFLGLVLVIMFCFAIMLLSELEILGISERILRLVDLLAVILMMLTAVVFVYYQDVLYSAYNGRVFADRVALFRKYMEIREDYSHTAACFYMRWGIGFLIFLAAFFLYVIIFVDKHVFKGKYDLSNYWRVRAHMALLMLLSSFFPIAEAIDGPTFYRWSLLFTITYRGSSPTISIASLSFIALEIFIILDLIVVILAMAVLPSKHVMKATPFISLALPEEEIIRRHRMLPIVMRYKNLVDYTMSLMMFVCFYIIYVVFVKNLGALAVEITYKLSTGILWTTTTAWLMFILIVFQAFLVFKPVR